MLYSEYPHSQETCPNTPTSSQEHGHGQGVPLPRVLPLTHLLLHLGRAQVRPAGEREAPRRHRRAHRRHPLLHRGHRALRVHGQDLQ